MAIFKRLFTTVQEYCQASTQGQPNYNWYSMMQDKVTKTIKKKGLGETNFEWPCMSQSNGYIDTLGLPISKNVIGGSMYTLLNA